MKILTVYAHQIRNRFVTPFSKSSAPGSKMQATRTMLSISAPLTSILCSELRMLRIG